MPGRSIAGLPVEPGSGIGRTVKHTLRQKRCASARRLTLKVEPRAERGNPPFGDKNLGSENVTSRPQELSWTLRACGHSGKSSWPVS